MTTATQPDLKQQGQQLESILCERYPEIFNKVKPRPLAIGIDKEICAALPDFDTAAVKAFLRFWTHRNAYLKAVAAERSVRVHLSGMEACFVDESHRSGAESLLAHREQRKQSK